jgi:syntaxin 5
MLPAMASSIQDRTPEFHSILSQAQKTLARQRKTGPQAQPLLQNGSAATPPTRKQRSEFARNAAAIGRGISATMGKLQRLGELAKRKTLFDDRPVEIAELTYVIKQDLAGLNQQIGNLQTIQRETQQGSGASNTTGQEGEHNKNVVMLLQGKLADVGVNFKEVLEVRTKNIQASRSRQDNFVSSVSQSHAPQSHLAPNGDRSDSPLYQPPSRSRTPGGGGAQQQQSPYASDVLSLDPSSSSPLYNNSPQSQQQLQIMEEGSSSNSYIQQRGEAIEAIERTIADLGGIFGQLATMVSEQAEQIQRIDANTDDVVDNVEGAQRELMKYWGRVQGNRWLVAKMFGVLMICEFSPSLSLVAFVANWLFCGFYLLTVLPHSLPPLGPHSRLRAQSPAPLLLLLLTLLCQLLLLFFCTHALPTPSVTITQNFLHIINDLPAFLQDKRGQKSWSWE